MRVFLAALATVSGLVTLGVVAYSVNPLLLTAAVGGLLVWLGAELAPGESR